jgi:AcrR family transcriptional regulator
MTDHPAKAVSNIAMTKRAPPSAAAGAQRSHRVRDPERARAAIFAAARSIFNTDGYFATNSNEIARAAGYAPGSFYTHFADKLGLFLEVYEAWVAAEWDAVGQAMAAPHPPRVRLDETIARLAQHHRDSRVFRLSLRALAALEPAVRDAQNAQRRRQIVWLSDLCAAEGWPEPSNAACAVVLLSLERVLDAVAEGDAAALDGDAAAVCHELSSLVYRLLVSDSPGSAAKG